MTEPSAPAPDETVTPQPALQTEPKAIGQRLHDPTRYGDWVTPKGVCVDF